MQPSHQHFSIGQPTERSDENGAVPPRAGDYRQEGDLTMGDPPAVIRGTFLSKRLPAFRRPSGLAIRKNNRRVLKLI